MSLIGKNTGKTKIDRFEMYQKHEINLKDAVKEEEFKKLEANKTTIGGMFVNPKHEVVAPEKDKKVVPSK